MSMASLATADGTPSRDPTQPRPALAVSTAQINLLSLKMASGAPPRRRF